MCTRPMRLVQPQGFGRATEGSFAVEIKRKQPNLNGGPGGGDARAAARRHSATKQINKLPGPKWAGPSEPSDFGGGALVLVRGPLSISTWQEALANTFGRSWVALGGAMSNRNVESGSERR